MSQPGFVGHVDADCFYVSADRVRDDAVAGVPAGVLGNQGACVIAKSYELKAHGVKTGEAIWEAAAKCPDGVFLKRDFRWYEELSVKMLEVVREFSPLVEFYSIDESFFEAHPGRGQSLRDYAAAIRDAILGRVGVPASIGIARTRTLAKLISDTAKPFGVGVLADGQAERAFLEEIPVTEIAGIAKRRAATLGVWGIRTCLQLANADRRLIRRLLTASGEAIWWELNGEPVTPISTSRPRHKVLARGGSFGDATSDPHVLFAWLVRNVERLIEELEYYEVLAGAIGLQVCYRDDRLGSAKLRLSLPTDRFDAILEAGRPCLRNAWIPHALATHMHLIAGKLRPRSGGQRGLFDADGGRAEKLARLKREVNDRHGRFTLRSGATLALRGVYEDDANDYDICDVRGKMCF